MPEAHKLLFTMFLQNVTIHQRRRSHVYLLQWISSVRSWTCSQCWSCPPPPAGILLYITSFSIGHLPPLCGDGSAPWTISTERERDSSPRPRLHHPAAAFIRFIGPCAGFAQLQIKSALYLCGKYQFSKTHTFVSTRFNMLKLERMVLFIWQRLHHLNPLLFFSCPQMLSWFLRYPSLHNLCCSAMFIRLTFCLMR